MRRVSYMVFLVAIVLEFDAATAIAPDANRRDFSLVRRAKPLLLPMRDVGSIVLPMRATRRLLALCVSMAVSCGGANQAPDAPDAEPSGEEPRSESPEPSAETEGEPKTGDTEPKEPAAPTAEPAFTPDMSVERAQAAVPVGTERQNIEQEALGRPLQEPGVFDSCQVGNARFKVRVAVWNGKAVGVDLETTPKNPALAECLKARVRELTWPDRVRSLNTVEYSF
jgi:hypothetical protein